MTASAPAVNAALDSILKEEGGWVDIPADRGGPTNFGITLPLLSQYLGHPATVDDLRKLDIAAARAVYLAIFINGTGYGAINDPAVLDLIVDCAVNHGPLRPNTWVQLALDCTPDGHFGAQTAAAVNSATPHAVCAAILAARARFYGKLIKNDVSQVIFDLGWMDRLAHFIEISP